MDWSFSCAAASARRLFLGERGVERLARVAGPRSGPRRTRARDRDRDRSFAAPPGRGAPRAGRAGRRRRGPSSSTTGMTRVYSRRAGPMTPSIPVSVSPVPYEVKTAESRGSTAWSSSEPRTTLVPRRIEVARDQVEHARLLVEGLEDLLQGEDVGELRLLEQPRRAVEEEALLGVLLLERPARELGRPVDDPVGLGLLARHRRQQPPADLVERQAAVLARQPLATARRARRACRPRRSRARAR